MRLSTEELEALELLHYMIGHYSEDAMGLLMPQAGIVANALTRLTTASPAGEVTEAMVTRYLDAVHAHLGGLTDAQWLKDKKDPANALRRVARIALTAALERKDHE